MGIASASGTVNFDSLFRALPDASPSWILYGKGPMLLCDLDLLVAVDKSKEGNVRQIGISNDNSKNYGSDENAKTIIEELKENNEYLREQNKMLLEKLLEK